MNEEEKKVVEHLKKTSKDRTIIPLDDEILIVLNLIEKLQKENEKYKQFFDLMLRLDSDYFMNCGDEETIKLVDEIEELESE